MGEWTIEQACEHVLGARLARSIISDMGVHWCVVAATADATTRHDRRALSAIQRYLDAAKRNSQAGRSALKGEKEGG